MGYASALGMAEAADRETALEWHLRSNHFPPVPSSMVAPCRQALEAIEGGEDRGFQIDLPDGIEYQGRGSAPVWAIFEQHHLDAFLEVNDACYENEDVG